MLSATFYGVRGSTPCSCDATKDFGGNTSCVLVELPGEAPIILDLGTGVRYLGCDLLERAAAQDTPAPFSGTALVSHLHWDHIQGTPFFRPILAEGAEIEIIGPRQIDSSLANEFSRLVRPPAFPVGLDELPGRLTFRGIDDDQLKIGSAIVTCFPVPHIGPTNGYRIDSESGSIVYISDHQQPVDGSLVVPPHVVERCLDVDILVHDAQFDADEFAQRSDWGHCTPMFALELARQCRAKRLVLFHHDPNHDDAWVRGMVRTVQAEAGSAIEVIGAAEGLQLHSGS